MGHPLAYPIPRIPAVQAWLRELKRRVRTKATAATSAKVSRTVFLRYCSWLVGQLGLQFRGSYTEPVLAYVDPDALAEKSPDLVYATAFVEGAYVNRYLVSRVLTKSVQDAQSAATVLRIVFDYLNRREFANVPLETIRVPENPPKTPAVPMLFQLLRHLGTAGQVETTAKVPRPKDADKKRRPIVKGVFAEYRIAPGSHEMNLAHAAVRYVRSILDREGVTTCLTEDGPALSWLHKKKGDPATWITSCMAKSPGEYVAEYLNQLVMAGKDAAAKREASFLRVIYGYWRELGATTFDGKQIELPTVLDAEQLDPPIPEVEAVLRFFRGRMPVRKKAAARKSPETPSEGYCDTLVRVFLRYVRSVMQTEDLQVTIVEGSDIPQLSWIAPPKKRKSPLSHIRACLLDDPGPRIATFLLNRQTQIGQQTLLCEASALRRAYQYLATESMSQFDPTLICAPTAIPARRIASEGLQRRTSRAFKRKTQYLEAAIALVDVIVRDLQVSFESVCTLTRAAYDPAARVLSVPFEGESVALPVRGGKVKKAFDRFLKEVAKSPFAAVWEANPLTAQFIISLDEGSLTVDDGSGICVLQEDSCRARDFAITALMQEFGISLALVVDLTWDAYDSTKRLLRLSRKRTVKLKDSTALIFDLWLRKRQQDAVGEEAESLLFPARDGKCLIVKA